MGDNRDHSIDARYWPEPFVDVTRVEARVYGIYWSSWRWSRIGKAPLRKLDQLMALEVWLTSNPEVIDSGEWICDLYANPAFWFLYSYFKVVAAETGQQIDPYGDASFSDISVLERELLRAQTDAAQLPDHSIISVGKNQEGLDVTDQLSRTDINTLIDSLLRAAARAKREEKWLMFIGD